MVAFWLDFKEDYLNESYLLFSVPSKLFSSLSSDRTMLSFVSCRPNGFASFLRKSFSEAEWSGGKNPMYWITKFICIMTRGYQHSMWRFFSRSLQDQKQQSIKILICYKQLDSWIIILQIQQSKYLFSFTADLSESYRFLIPNLVDDKNDQFIFCPRLERICSDNSTAMNLYMVNKTINKQ